MDRNYLVEKPRKVNILIGSSLYSQNILGLLTSCCARRLPIALLKYICTRIANTIGRGIGYIEKLTPERLGDPLENFAGG
jgi:hypothetical protein